MSWDLDAQFNLFVALIQFRVSRRNKINIMADRSADVSRSCAGALHNIHSARALEWNRDTIRFLSLARTQHLHFFFDNASAISFYRPRRVVFAVWNSLRILFRVRLWMKSYRRYFQFQLDRVGSETRYF